ncbi:energy-coupling factor transporter ATPase [uncultured Ruminococcus sp.]|uniref:energy-coupling factor transporter ATPase n=1 Tax=uncultured Ruminococcus sp. TaxID=165186 RepID=UPI00292F581E|nr:energy-coupling factor transporter ATPase [uncultured Ruminococcus sp.]
MSLLSVKDVSFVYSQKTPFQHTAVENVSFDVDQGDFIGIIGHTGSGKSTLVQMLNGLLKPTSGSITLDGINIWDKPKEIRKIRFRVGLVFQYPEYQLFEETVEKDISFGPMNMGLSEEEIKERVHKAAQFVGLDTELLQKSPFDLSGGEKRRAAIAGVIAMDPDILILDEPCAGLDPLGRDVLLAQIYRYHQQRGNTVLLVSHSMEDVAAVCDKALVMNHSHLEMYDTCDRIFSQGDRLATMGLRVPQITAIVDDLIAAGFPLNQGTLTVENAVHDITEYLKKEGRL